MAEEREHSAPAGTLFVHDGCDNCVYLGPYGEHEDKPTHDLWFCPQSGNRTVMARYGNEGWEYHSGWASSLTVMEEARRRAVARRLTNAP